MDASPDFSPIATLDLTPIKRKLMHTLSGEGWSLEQAEAVEEEYRRFLFLMKAFPDEHTAPLVEVDIFWHYHILDTVKYAADCKQVFGYFLHHDPYNGLGAADSRLAHQRSAVRMRELYEAEFNETYGAKLSSAGGNAKNTNQFDSAAYCGMTVAPAYCGMTVAPTYCGMTEAPAYYGATAATVYCGATAATAYCGITAAPAYCGATAATASCGAMTGATDKGASATRDADAAAYCGAMNIGSVEEATTEENAITARDANAAYCGAIAAVAYCGRATAPEGRRLRTTPAEHWRRADRSDMAGARPL